MPVSEESEVRMDEAPGEDLQEEAGEELFQTNQRTRPSRTTPTRAHTQKSTPRKNRVTKFGGKFSQSFQQLPDFQARNPNAYPLR